MTDKKDFNNADLEDDINDVDEKDIKRERVLRGILDSHVDKKYHFLAVSSNMGSSRSYISSVPLKWFASNVRFASEQPIETFRGYRDEHGKSVDINKDTLDFISQRKPDWSRQLAMTTYLSVRKHRKFPPVLLVAYQDWIFDSTDDRWGPDKRALEDSVTYKSLDSLSHIVDLNHLHTQFYALDGQHRLMAVKGFRDLLEGSLQHKKKDGTPTNKSITIQDFISHFQKNINKDVSENEIRIELNSIMDEERIGVEIIPAVQVKETIEEAFVRLRQIFVDVNQNAKSLAKGELALLDETNGFRIVARQVMVIHPLFRDKNSDGELLVDTKSKQLSETGDYYTTLDTMVEIARRYLGQFDKFHGWKENIGNVKGVGSLRPEDEELEEARKKLQSYFDAMMTLPSHKKMTHGKRVSDIRSSEKQFDDNILFRPMTQEALATALGRLETRSDEHGGSISLEDAISKLGRGDNPDEPHLRLTNPASPFFGILCDPIDKKMRRTESYKKLATRMFMFLLGGETQSEEEQEKLREAVFNSRRVFEDEETTLAIGYDGNHVEEAHFQLPSPW